MKWLIWKDYRLNRLILIVGAVLLILPHLVALDTAWYWSRVGGHSALQWKQLFLAATFYSLAFSQLTLLLLGGNTIACERSDRSAEFLAYLPYTRVSIIASKIMLAILVAAVIWAPNLLIQLLIEPGVSLVIGPLLILGYIAATGALCFSVAWLFSSFSSSPTFSICLGLFSPYAVLVVLWVIALAAGYPVDGDAWLLTAAPWYLRACPILALIFFAAGTSYYLRRVEP